MAEPERKMHRITFLSELTNAEVMDTYLPGLGGCKVSLMQTGVSTLERLLRYDVRGDVRESRAVAAKERLDSYVQKVDTLVKRLFGFSSLAALDSAYEAMGGDALWNSLMYRSGMLAVDVLLNAARTDHHGLLDRPSSIDEFAMVFMFLNSRSKYADLAHGFGYLSTSQVSVVLRHGLWIVYAHWLPRYFGTPSVKILKHFTTQKSRDHLGVDATTVVLNADCTEMQISPGGDYVLNYLSWSSKMGSISTSKFLVVNTSGELVIWVGPAFGGRNTEEIGLELWATDALSEMLQYDCKLILLTDRGFRLGDMPTLSNKDISVIAPAYKGTLCDTSPKPPQHHTFSSY